MKSNVYFIKVKDGEGVPSLAEKAGKLFDRAGFKNAITKNDMVAVKTSFGEKGNIGYLKPPIIKSIVDKVKDCNGKPFLIETNTLYVGQRSNAIDHLIHAHERGFNYENVGAPVIIGDGLLGENNIQVEIDQKSGKHANVAGIARASNAIVSIAHVTGHLATGMGATLKNIGMGLSSRGGKLVQHSGLLPQIQKERCSACGVCAKWCPVGTINVINKCAVIGPDKCIGCGECLAVCQFGAVKIAWDESTINLQKKVAEHTLAVLQGKEGKSIFFNFLTHITQHCDCMNKPYEPDIADIGIIASRDPVAIEQATTDIIEKHIGKDFFKDSWPNIDYTVQINYAREIGLGSMDYELVNVD